MDAISGPSAILVTSYPGQPSAAELARQAAAGERPRRDYVELARLLGAEVIDSHYMAERATPRARLLAARFGLPAGQVAEAFARRTEFGRICAWADRLGLPLALLFKLARARRDLVVVSQWVSVPKKAIFLKRFHVQSHIRALVSYSSVQMEYAAAHLGVPRQKLHRLAQPVDERFWRPLDRPADDLICAVGMEARDYPTLIAAVRGLDLPVELAVGSLILPTGGGRRRAAVVGQARASLPGNVRLGLRTPLELRDLYARSRFVVLPLRDVDVDAGVTALTEALAMGKAVIVSRTRGQVDVLRDGEHGLYVPPGDPYALRQAIEYLRTHPDEAERMGRAGRALIERHCRLDDYVARLAAIVREGRAPHPAAATAAELDRDALSIW